MKIYSSERTYIDPNNRPVTTTAHAYGIYKNNDGTFYTAHTPMTVFCKESNPDGSWSCLKVLSYQKGMIGPDGNFIDECEFVFFDDLYGYVETDLCSTGYVKTAWTIPTKSLPPYIKN